MKIRLSTIFIFGLLALSSLSVAAQSPSYETPEYSGQSPRFDRGLDNYRDNSNALRASRERLQAIQRDRRNDLAVERQNAVRSMRVQNEMARKREESLRANQQHILKTNQ
jgi:hypothetical protein